MIRLCLLRFLFTICNFAADLQHCATHIQVSDVGTFYTSAVTTSGEVRCEMPVFPLDTNTTLQLYNWTVYLSSDNSTWSNGTQMLVYDPLCVACGEPENETGITCLPSQVNQYV